MGTKDYEDNPFVAEALAAKYRAEADELLEKARYQRSQADMGELYAEKLRMETDFRLAADIEHYVYRLSDVIDEKSVPICIEHLTRWSRLNPGCDITIKLNSPGGFVTDGMDLFDTILELRDEGHKVSMIGRGYVASMAAILLQAGDVRAMGPGCAMLIHEPSGMARGSLGDIEDTKSWLDMTASRVLDIYADRCASSGAEKPYTRAQLKAGWNRKNWWISSEACLKGGLVDEIR